MNKWFMWKHERFPLWHLKIGKLRIQWWTNSTWLRKLEIGW